MAYAVDVINPFSALQEKGDEVVGGEQQVIGTGTGAAEQNQEVKVENNVAEIEGQVDDEGFSPAIKGGRRTRSDQGFGRDRGSRIRPTPPLQKVSRKVEEPSLGPAPQQGVPNKYFLSGRGKEQGRGRGRGKNRSSLDERGKREFDRFDGTGRGHEVEKRSGTGRGNWGTFGDEYGYTTAEEEEEVVKKEESGVEVSRPQMNDIVKGENGKENAATTAVNVVEPTKPDEKVVTLEEYEKQRKDNLKGKKKRDINEGLTQKQFEGMKVMKKEEPDLDQEMGLTKIKELGRAKSGDGVKPKKEKELATDLACFTIGDDRGVRSRGANNNSGTNGQKKETQSEQNGREPDVSINDFSFPQLEKQ